MANDFYFFHINIQVDFFSLLNGMEMSIYDEFRVELKWRGDRWNED